MNAALWRPWLRSVTVGVCLFLGILAGSWGLTRWYANHIQSLIETRAVLQVEIKEATPDRRAAQGDDVGRGSRHEVRAGAEASWSCPRGRSDYPPWTVGGTACRAGYRASEGVL